jgi:hypothetical protein
MIEDGEQVFAGQVLEYYGHVRIPVDEPPPSPPPTPEELELEREMDTSWSPRRRSPGTKSSRSVDRLIGRSADG